MGISINPDQADHVEHLVRRVRGLTAGVGILALSWLGMVAWVLTSAGSPEHHDVLSVERLEIVEPDGERAIVLANSQRAVPATFDGQVLLEGQEEERRHPTIIFFDGHGDEVGGMTFSNETTEDGFRAIRHFAMDGYKQDETMALRHHQDAEGTSTGFHVFYRPQDRTLEEILAGHGLELPVTRQEVEALIEDLREGGRDEELRQVLGARRVFLGSDRDNLASLVLRDGLERPRILLGAPAEGDPFIRVLDAEGQILAEFPE